MESRNWYWNKMKNLLDDPDVMALYKSLQTNKFEDIEDYLTSSYEDFKKPIIIEKIHKPEIENLPSPKIFWGGEEVSDFIGDNDYGL